MERTSVSQTQLVNQVLGIGHGDLSIYNTIGLLAAEHEAELLGHLIAWNQNKGEIRDNKVALPVLALRGKPDQELYENAVAHLCLLSPRDLLRACKYHRSLPVTPPGGAGMLKEGVTRFLRERE